MVTGYKRKIPARNIKVLQERLHAWYRQHRRRLPWRETADPYYIWVSEVMLQQTQVKTVLRYYPEFIGRFPDIHSLARADLQQVLKSWELMGYYARARNLHRAAQRVVAGHGGIIPRDYTQFRRLPGVGDYIAAAVTSIAFQAPQPVVDGNVKRVLARLFLVRHAVNSPPAQAVLRELAGYIFDRENPGEFNQAIMDIGALICKPRNPSCPQCPLSAFCSAFRHNQQGDFPRRLSTAPIPCHHIAVGVVVKAGKFLITRRPESGLLGGLWEFPGGKVMAGELPPETCRRELREELNLEIDFLQKVGQVKHAYTHFRIIMDVYLCRYHSGKVRLNGPVDFRWISPQQLGDYPFPAANHKIFSCLEKSYREFLSPTLHGREDANP